MARALYCGKHIWIQTQRVRDTVMASHLFASRLSLQCRNRANRYATPVSRGKNQTRKEVHTKFPGNTTGPSAMTEESYPPAWNQRAMRVQRIARALGSTP